VEQLVRRHQASVRGYLLYLGCPVRLVDDLVQDAFLSVLGSDFEDRGDASTAAFLRTVARNLLLKTLRRERRHQPVADFAASEHAEQVWVEFEEGDGGDDYLGALRECLQGITGRVRSVLGLRYHSNLRRTAIAGKLGMSENGVKSILARARKQLRGCIERRLDQ